MNSANRFHIGETVKWDWGTGQGTGKVVERHEDELERTLKGSKVKRNGTAENPAYLIEQDDGDQVLKLGSELDAN
jgi:hypothetical protein